VLLSGEVLEGTLAMVLLTEVITLVTLEGIVILPEVLGSA
jgi:hypothetical protein